MFLLIGFALLIILAALLPMLYTATWNVRIALVLFFFAYPALKWVGPIGLGIMWLIAGAFIIIPQEIEDRREHSTDR